LRRPHPAGLLHIVLLAAALPAYGSAAADRNAPASQSRAASSADSAKPKVVSIKAARAVPVGAVVTIEGVVTTPPGAFKSSTEDEGFAIEDASGAGVYVRTNVKADFGVGRRVRVTGKLDESNGKLVIVPAGERGMGQRGRGVAPVPAPRRFSTREIGEATEGRLVRVAGRMTKPVQMDVPYGFRFFVDDGTGEVQIFVSASTNVSPANLRPGLRVAVTGFSGQYKDHYEVEPRFAADISVRPPRLAASRVRPRRPARRL
jgi:uncharacterized protein YdeI (BOF family)